jgi:hypothetical protein
MAGNIAEAIDRNSALIPWLEKQFRAGAEIAGLCTGALFIAQTSLINQKHCRLHWFVDATFRSQYPQINSLAENVAVEPESVQTGAGAWLFFHNLLARAAGEETAFACSTDYRGLFDQECQSVVAVSDSCRQLTTRSLEKEREPMKDCQVPEMSLERFISPPGASSAVLDDKAQHRQNVRTFKELFRKIERHERSCSNGETKKQTDG